jgi:hypothetical protein
VLQVVQLVVVTIHVTVAMTVVTAVMHPLLNVSAVAVVRLILMLKTEL